MDGDSTANKFFNIFSRRSKLLNTRLQPWLQILDITTRDKPHQSEKCLGVVVSNDSILLPKTCIFEQAIILIDDVVLEEFTGCFLQNF